MTLVELKTYVQQRKVVSLVEIAMHFRADESAIEPMMERWIQKGVIRSIVMDTGSCGSCTTCPPGLKKHYEWIGDQAIQITRTNRLN